MSTRVPLFRLETPRHFGMTGTRVRLLSVLSREATHLNHVIVLTRIQEKEKKRENERDRWKREEWRDRIDPRGRCELCRSAKSLFIVRRDPRHRAIYYRRYYYTFATPDNDRAANKTSFSLYISLFLSRSCAINGLASSSISMI